MLSIIFSMVVIGWAFSIPKRDRNQSQASSTAVSQTLSQLDVPEDHVIRGDSAEDIRETMLAADHEFMRNLAKRQAANGRDLPGLEETKVKWQQRFQRVQREARQFEQAEKGSIEWAYRQERMQSLKDGPR